MSVVAFLIRSAGHGDAFSFGRTGLASAAIGIARTFGGGVFAAVASAVGTGNARIRLRLIIAAGRFVRRVDFRARFQNARFVGTFFVFVAFRVDRAFRIAAFRHARIALLFISFRTLFAFVRRVADLIARAIRARFASRFDADAVDLVRFAVAFRAFRRIAFKTVRKLRRTSVAGTAAQILARFARRARVLLRTRQTVRRTRFAFVFRSVVSVRTRNADANFVFADFLVAANGVRSASARSAAQQSVPRDTSFAHARRFAFRAVRNGTADAFAILVFELSFCAFDRLDSLFLCGRYSRAAVVRASQLDRLRVGVSRCEQQADRRQKQYFFHDFPLFRFKVFPGLSLRES